VIAIKRLGLAVLAVSALRLFDRGGTSSIAFANKNIVYSMPYLRITPAAAGIATDFRCELVTPDTGVKQASKLCDLFDTRKTANDCGTATSKAKVRRAP
jgi:hypothetical protein